MARTARHPVDFENPPVVEVAIAVQFDDLQKLTTPHLGRFWASIADEFPRVEEYVPRPPSVETFPRQQAEVQQFLLQLTGRSPVSRCWFVSPDGGQLIQIQADRFVFNWRKQESGYPRYAYVRKCFDEYLDRFRRFLTEHAIGDVTPNQCEVSYVNRLDVAPDRLAQLTPLWAGRHADDFLPKPETITNVVSYPMYGEHLESPIGRLRVSITSDGSATTLTLTARGTPQPENLEGVGNVLDIGHEWIVNGFVSITTQRMHSAWGRK
jgi:uncharacterized protein (TIGR04255 family)